jgi:hypothetical protein
MREELNTLIKSLATLTVPAAETKSIGLQHLRIIKVKNVFGTKFVL